MSAIDVYIECEVVEARVLMGLPSDLSVFENYVLRAIDAGATSVAKLVNVLEVSHRILVDALGDLWRAEHIVVDLPAEEERVSLSEKTRTLLAGDKLSELGCAYQTQEKRPLLFDTLTGRLLPMRAATRLTSRELRDLRVPRAANDPRPKDLLRATLIRGIDEDLRRPDQVADEWVTAGRTRLRVIDAYLVPEPVQSRPRFVPLLVQVAVDEVLGLRVWATDQRLPELERRLATVRLQRIVDESPNSVFVKALLRDAPKAPLYDPPPLRTAAADLKDKVTTLDQTAPGTRQSQHDRMRGELAQLKGRLAGFTARDVSADLVDSETEHVRIIRSMIDNAGIQFILAGPWVSHAGLDKYMPQLQRAADRGVQLVILWGIGPDDSLDNSVTNAIENLQRRSSRSRVLVKTKVPARIHAKIAVSDNRAALVSSYNFLREHGRREIGVHVTAHERRRCEAIENLLTWSADMMPDHDLAQAIICSPESFGEYTEWPAAAQIIDPRYSPLLDTDQAGSAACTAWALSWASAVHEAEQLVASLPTAAQTVRDAEHQAVFRSALSNCQRRLLVASDQLSGSVVDSEWISTLDACLRRGVDVLIVYQRLHRDATDALAMLEKLAAQQDDHRGQLVVRHDEANHAKVLVWDDESLVGSFNFLSFPGHYAGRGRQKDRGELSIHIVGAAFADSLMQAFGSESSLSSIPTTLQGDAPSSAAVDLDLALQLLESFDAQGHLTAADIAALATSGSARFSVAEALAKIGAPEEVQERVCAAVLAHEVGHNLQPWWVRLLGFAWNRADFVAAHAIRSVVDSPDVRPRRLLTAVAASIGSATFTDLLTEAALAGDLSRDETAALVLTSAASLLSCAESEIAEVLVALSGEIGTTTEVIHSVGVAAQEFYNTVGRPLPVEALQAQTSEHQRTLDLDSQWSRLEQALDRVRSYSPGYLSGKLVQAHLFSKDGPFTELERYVAACDSAGVALWRENQASLDVGQWLNRITATAGVRPIEGGRREPFVTRLANVFAVTRQIVVLSPAESDTTPSADPAVWRCVERLRGILPDASATVESLSGPERVLCDHAIARLYRLIHGESYD